MKLYNRRDQLALDQLVADYTRHGLNRRTFLQRAMAIGLSASSASAILAACGGSTPPGGTGGVPTATSLDVVNVWSDEEKASFLAVTKPFSDEKKITINVESTRDLDAELTARLRSKNPPDIAILPNPGKMKQLVQQNHLIRLDAFLDMNKIHHDYDQSWTTIGTVNGGLYAIFYKIANKGTVWYSPAQFQSNKYKVPQTWSDLISLSDQIAANGKYPWAIGVESGAASGWPATDWIAEIYLNTFGPEKYDGWINHTFPWTDGSVKTAFQTFGSIIGGKHYVNGAPQSILATGFKESSYQPFSTPPGAYMCYLGDFAEGFITQQYPNAKAGTDFDFFPFPTIKEQYKAVTGGADVIVALKDNTAVRDLIKYLVTADAQSIWVKRGGFISPNKSVHLSDYPNDVSRKSAQMITAGTFRYGAGDMLPPAVQQQFWKGVLTFIQDQKQLDSVLGDIESAAAQAYAS